MQVFGCLFEREKKAVAGQHNRADLSVYIAGGEKNNEREEN
jgi:hypothetical protein